MKRYTHVDGSPCKPKKDGTPRICAGGYQEEKQNAWGEEVFQRALPLAQRIFGLFHLAILARYCCVDSGYTACAKIFQNFVGSFDKVKDALKEWDEIKNNRSINAHYQLFREKIFNQNINSVIKKVYKFRKKQKIFEK